MKMDLATRQPVVDLSASAYVPAFAYKHDGSTLAYLLHNPSTGKAALHWRTNGQDTTYALNSVPGRGVGPDDEVRLQYAPDDKYLLMVDTFVGQQDQAPETGQFIVFRADNTLAFVPASTNATCTSHPPDLARGAARDSCGTARSAAPNRSRARSSRNPQHAISPSSPCWRRSSPTSRLRHARPVRRLPRSSATSPTASMSPTSRCWRSSPHGGCPRMIGCH